MRPLSLCWRVLLGLGAAAPYFFLLFVFGCAVVKPQKGGQSTVSLGGGAGPTTSTLTAPENPKTATKQTVEKTTTREWVPQTPVGKWQSQGASSSPAKTGPESEQAVHPLRETVSEKSTIELGSSWEDKARELGARLANMRGVMWVGVLLLIGGPIVGWKMGWLINGMIAGGVGLLLIILSTVIPGNEAWFGLGGLVVIPLVGFVYYRAQYDADKDGIPDRLQRNAGSAPPSPLDRHASTPSSS